MTKVKRVLLTLLLPTIVVSTSAQNEKFKYGATPADSLRCVENISAFQLYYNQKNYLEAYPYWEQVVTQCPRAWNGIFAYAQTMFGNLIQAEKDSLTRAKYIDRLLWSYEVRHTYFPERYTEGNGLGYRAFNTALYRGIRHYAQAYEWFTQSVELEKAKTEPAIWDLFFKTAVQITVQRRDTTIIIEAYERATEYIDAAITEAFKNYDKVMANFENLNAALEAQKIDIQDYEKRAKPLTADTIRQLKLVENYRKVLSNIEKVFMDYASCDKLVLVYNKKFETSRDDIETLQKMVGTLSKRGCTNTPIFAKILEIVHRNNPNAQTAFWTGTLMLKSDTTLNKAIEYLNQAISLYETNEQKIEAYYFLGLAHQLKSNFPEARAAALNAIKYKPNCGKAYLLIGDLYAASSSRCGGDDQVPYANNWAAADKYSRAAAVDPSVADRAQEARAKLKFPSKEDKFTRGLSEGASYKVGCWIQETTTVR